MVTISKLEAEKIAADMKLPDNATRARASKELLDKWLVERQQGTLKFKQDAFDILKPFM